jgi:hypothetical protein
MPYTYLTNERVRTFLTTRYGAFVAVHGRKECYSRAQVLFFAGLLSRDREARTCTMLLPWQVAKTWALDNGQTTPAGEQRESGDSSIRFTFPDICVHEVANLFAFPTGEGEHYDGPGGKYLAPERYLDPTNTNTNSTGVSI